MKDALWECHLSRDGGDGKESITQRSEGKKRYGGNSFVLRELRERVSEGLEL